MFKLMKLEWKKHKLSRYFKSVAICIIASSKPYGIGNESRGKHALLGLHTEHGQQIFLLG